MSLERSDRPLYEVYDLAMLDLDGVVYIGPEAVPGAPEHVERARAAGMRVAFVTNNARRPPGAVAAHLRELGVDARDDDVVTSAQAAARVLLDRLGPDRLHATVHEAVAAHLATTPVAGPASDGR